MKQQTFPDRFDSRSAYVNRYRHFVELERQAEIQRHEEEIRRLKGWQREKKGRALVNMRGRRAGRALGGRQLVKYMKQDVGQTLPDHDMQVGDMVLVSSGFPLKKGNPLGTVVEKSRFSLTVVFDRSLPKWATKRGLRVDLYVNDITYQRMLSALNTVLQGREASPHLVESMIGMKGKQPNQQAELCEWIDLDLSTLNPPQQQAVKAGLGAREFHIVHGPPGTGKTVTALEILKQASQKYDRILACADSNGAVDNLVEGLLERDLRVVRIGHPFRVSQQLLEHTLDAQLENHPQYAQVQAHREEAFNRMKDQEGLTHPSSRWTRGMSRGDILRFAKKGKGSRGVPADKIKEMAQWLELREDVDKAFAKAEQLEQELIEDILKQADVILTTNAGAGADLLEGRVFDLVVIDEATQSTEPACLIPMVLGKRLILLGDHKQLPPTVLSREAEQKGLSYTLMDRLLRLYKGQFKTLLSVQYRMHEDIMRFSSQVFYEGELTCGPDNQHWRLPEVGGALAQTPYGTMVNNGVDWFLPVSGQEARMGEGPSLYNKEEAKHVVQLVKDALDSGVNGRQIAVISPYKAQAKYIASQLLSGAERVECDTVDGFQGREKDMVVISLVRSNDRDHLGFLSDLRRLNVAVTRAKKLRIVVGDPQTISSHPVYAQYLASARTFEE